MRNTIDLFIHKSNFDILKRRKAEKEKRRKCGKKRANWKTSVSKRRGQEKANKRNNERRRIRGDMRKRKMEEKMRMGRE